MLTNCFRFAPRDSVPGLIAKICKYMKDHPGWSEEELEEQIARIIGENSVESFNGRTGDVVLNEDDVNNLKIASAYFAEGDETINDLNLIDLYNRGVRFVFTNWNSVTSGYDLAFVLEYFGGSNDVVYYPMATGSGGGGNIVSVNGKTGVVELSLSDILGDSGAQVKLCTATEFTSTTIETWNAYYDDGYRIIGVVNSDASAVDYIYLLKQDENNHQPIGLSAGASDAYTPDNPPPYPVTKVNGQTGDVILTSLRTTDGLKYLYVVSATGGCQMRLSRRASSTSVTTYNDTMTFETASPYKIKHRHYTSTSGQIGTDITATLYTDKNPPPYPVKSVNGQTGDVVLPETTSGVESVNGKTGVVTGLYDADNPPPYPVTSVNGQTGDVVLPESTGGVESVNGKTGAVTGVYDTDNPPPYPVTSVNESTGAVTVKRLYSAGSSAELLVGDYATPLFKLFYTINHADGFDYKCNSYINTTDDTIHIDYTGQDGTWKRATLYTTANPPSGGGTAGIAYKGVVSCSVSGSGSDTVTANFNNLAGYVGGNGFVVFKYYATTSDNASIAFNADGAGIVHTAMVGSSSPYPLAAEGTFTVPLSILDGTTITIENVSLGGSNIYINSSNFKAYVYN